MDVGVIVIIAVAVGAVIVDVFVAKQVNLAAIPDATFGNLAVLPLISPTA